MTREEQHDWLCRLRSKVPLYMPNDWVVPMSNALDMSIKSIEPSETVLNKELQDRTKALPPVHKDRTVQDFADKCRECGKQKKWEWIKRENIHGLEQYYQCSNCGNHCLYEHVEIGFKNAKTKYCPNCGAEMESEK